MCFHLEVHQKYLNLVDEISRKEKEIQFLGKLHIEILEFYAPFLGLCPLVTESCSVPPVFRHFRASNTQQAEQLLMNSNKAHCHNQLIPLMFGQNNN